MSVRGQINIGAGFQGMNDRLPALSLVPRECYLARGGPEGTDSFRTLLPRKWPVLRGMPGITPFEARTEKYGGSSFVIEEIAC